MELMLEVISRQKFSLGPGAQHVFSEVGGYIGRGEECEWVLPDKAKQISRKHALVSYDHSCFMLEDLSTNGVFNALGKERLARQRKYKIEHGATYVIGEYSIQARLLHKPDSCLSEGDTAEDLIPDGGVLADDPLLALDQQDELNARRRLGMYSDLLGAAAPKTAFQPDHTEAPLSAMPAVTVLPEDWDATDEEDGAAAQTGGKTEAAAAPSSGEEAAGPAFPGPELPGPEPSGNGAAPEVEAFFRALGYEAAPPSPQERERVMLQAAELLLASVDGMLQALRNRADSKNDLRLPVTTMTLAGNNPLKFSPTAKAALEYLLAPPAGGMLPAVRAMLNGFEDLHSHNMGLIAGARAAVQAALARISPDAVEAKLDAGGALRFSRAARLWSAYVRLHAGLRDESNGFAAFLLDDFARAYELQVRTLYPAFNRQGGKQ